MSASDLNAYMNQCDDDDVLIDELLTGPPPISRILVTIITQDALVSLRTERDELRALLVEAQPVVKGAIWGMCIEIATEHTTFDRCHYCGKPAATFLAIAHESYCVIPSQCDLLARIDARLAKGAGDEDAISAEA